MYMLKLAVGLNVHRTEGVGRKVAGETVGIYKRLHLYQFSVSVPMYRL
jgi:hypothetical protein